MIAIIAMVQKPSHFDTVFSKIFFIMTSNGG